MSLTRCAGALALAAGLALLAACAAPPPSRGTRTPQPQPPVPLAAPSSGPPPRIGPRYRVLPESSDVRIFVTRAGPLAALGHDHVIDGRALSGWVQYQGAADRATFELSMPVAALSVDDPELRREAGGDFAEALGEEARNGTRANMLSAAVLDAERHPTLLIRSVAVMGSAPHLTATVAVEVAGHSSLQQVAFDLSVTPGRLRAQGELELKQSALGLTPFGLFLGALRVEDVLRVRFDVSAIGS